MTNELSDEALAEIINKITEKLSKVLLKEFLKLSNELQLNIVLIKSVQLLLANILCQIARDNDELQLLSDEQGKEIAAVVTNCVYSGFNQKFNLYRH